MLVRYGGAFLTILASCGWCAYFILANGAEGVDPPVAIHAILGRCLIIL